MGLRHRRSPGVVLWSLGFALATLVAQWQSQATGGWQFARPAYAAGAWWQLLTAQWVHLGLAHACANVAGMLVLLVSFQQLVDGRLQGLALLGGYAGVALVLALDPGCAFYAGASGALHGLLAGGALSLVLAHPSDHAGGSARSRWLGGLLLLGLAVKLALQHMGGDAAAPGWLGFATYYPAHEAGALGGLVAVLLARLGRAPWFAQPVRH